MHCQAIFRPRVAGCICSRALSLALFQWWHVCCLSYPVLSCHGVRPSRRKGLPLFVVTACTKVRVVMG